jgi:2-polyprenyl-3-methyl-5-hydroxy-6-metoxy-1,4-benzoquinol methylase
VHTSIPRTLVEPDPDFDAFAAREPFFAVITDPGYQSRRLTAEARGRFFADGEAIVEAMYRTVSLSLDPYFAPTAVLEYGCGAGRLALPMARRAAQRGGHLTASDRSPAMLEHAARHAAEGGITNISFVSPGDLLGDASRRFDFVACYLVLQRLKPADGLVLVRSLLSTLLPGGVGVFQFPVRSQVRGVLRLVRRAREASSIVNQLVQWTRKDAVGGPFVPSHVYDLNAVVDVFGEAGAAATHVVFDDHGDLQSVLAFVQLPDTAAAVHSPMNGSPIDVRDVIATTPVGALNQAAEEYFSSLASWDHHLAKPFASADESPDLLADAAVVIRALHLHPGLTVIDFGAGSGWLSRSLTQLGAGVIAMDVSATALRMARALYQRVPVVGDRPSPAFLAFDGLTIPLAEASVDRVVCFHAFHHVPDQERVIAEFARVLKPGGLAVFAEPGRHHSKSAKSQFEMRSYRVIENDVDVHEVWRIAERCGFAGIRMFASSGTPLELSLADYEDLIRGGPTNRTWAELTRRHLRNTSNFVLIKAGRAAEDSRSASGLSCVLYPHVATGRVAPGSSLEIGVSVTNSGTARWLPSGEQVGGVTIGVRISAEDGRLLVADAQAGSLAEPPRSIAPGERVDCTVRLPPLSAGRYRVELDCVAAGVAWFAETGSRPAVLQVVVE